MTLVFVKDDEGNCLEEVRVLGIVGYRSGGRQAKVKSWSGGPVRYVHVSRLVYLWPGVVHSCSRHQTGGQS